MRNLFLIVVGVSALVLGGCAVNSGVHPASDPSAFSGAAYSGQTTKVNDPTTAEQYRLFNQAAVGQVSTDMGHTKQVLTARLTESSLK